MGRQKKAILEQRGLGSIATQLTRKIWAQRGWDYLKTCRYSLQTPWPRHKKGNKGEQEAFKKTPNESY